MAGPIADALTAEAANWPMVECRIEPRADCFVAILEFCGKDSFLTFAEGADADEAKSLNEMARILRSLGAVRKKSGPQAAVTETGTAGAVRSSPVAGTISEPGEYDLDDATYHGDPCKTPSLSASLAKLMVKRTPWHAWHAHPRLNPNFEEEDQKKFDLGSVFHKEILGKGQELAVLPFKDYRSNAAKDARDQALRDGLQPCLEEQHERAAAMASAARRQMRRWPDLALAMAGGIPERTLIWREDNGIMCRMKLDWQPHTGLIFPDWKSTAAGAGPDEWGQKVMWDTGCDIQDAFYRRGIAKVLGREGVSLLFAVVETDEPHAMMPHRVTPAAAAMADRKVEWAIRVFGMCLDANRWPGYPGEVAWHDPPPWQERKWTDREDNGLTDPGFMQAMIEGVHSVDKADKASIVADDRADGFGLLPVGEDGDEA